MRHMEERYVRDLEVTSGKAHNGNSYLIMVPPFIPAFWTLPYLSPLLFLTKGALDLWCTFGSATSL